MRVRRSRLEVLAILDFVDLHGADAASAKYRVDRRTLLRWAAKEPAGWQREEEHNRLLMVQKRIEGNVSYRDATVGAGIATDKLWRQADRDRMRAVEPEPEPPNPIAQQLARLDDRRQRLLADELRYELARRDAGLGSLDTSAPVVPRRSDEVALEAMTTLVDELLAMADDDVVARSAVIAREHAEVDRIRLEQREAAAPRVEKDVTPADEPLRPSNPRVVPRTSNSPLLLDTGGQDWQWHEIERRDRP